MTTVGRTWLALVRQFILCGLIGASLLLAGGARDAWGEAAEANALEQIKSQLDEIEAALGREDVTAEMLAGFRQSLNAATDAVRAKIDELEPRLRELEERLKQLGPAPAKDAPPEAEEVTNERDELTATISEVDGALKQARLLSVKIDQLSERLAQKRHALYAGELFARSPSILDPFFWRDAFH